LEEYTFTPPTTQPLLLDELRVIVAQRFQVLDAYLEFGIPSFVLASGPTKMPFKALRSELAPRSLIPILRSQGDNLILRVYTKPRLNPSRGWVNIIFFILTLSAVTFFGYMFATSPFLVYLEPQQSIYLRTLLYIAAMLMVIGLHEVGHKIMCETRGIDATMPYFIPGLVGGTFGAIIMLREPPTNKDDLFDIGLAGPLVGFAASIIVAVAGIQLSYVLPVAQVEAWVEKNPELALSPLPWGPPILDLLIMVFKPIPADGNYVFLLHPVAYAAWLGFVILYLQLLPAWQLDGGRALTAVLGPRRMRYISFIGVAVMFLTGFWLMALLMWLLSARAVDPGPLDDVSTLSQKRKGLALLIPVILVLTVVFIPFPFFGV